MSEKAQTAVEYLTFLGQQGVIDIAGSLPKICLFAAKRDYVYAVKEIDWLIDRLQAVKGLLEGAGEARYEVVNGPSPDFDWDRFDDEMSKFGFKKRGDF